MKTNKKSLIGAAMYGILSAGMMSAVYASTNADSNANADSNVMGKCYGANQCKVANKCKHVPTAEGAEAKNSCGGNNGCSGNACKGKGFIETSKAKCDKMAKKNNKIHFEPKASESE